MSLGSYLMSQFARPHGLLGGLFASTMNRGNRLINERSMDALEIGSGARVLDVGFGGGASLEALISERGCGYVGGLDPATKMVEAAERRLAAWIKEGRLAVKVGAVESIPWPDAEFDAALSVNSLYYWPDPARGLREIWRVLRPGGRLALGLRDKASMDKLGDLSRLGYWSPAESEVAKLLEDAGFASVSTQHYAEAAKGNFVVFGARK